MTDRHAPAATTTFDRLRAHLDSRPETRVLWQDTERENALVTSFRFLCDLIDQQAAAIASLRRRLESFESDGK
jgi:hypothetical protein